MTDLSLADGWYLMSAEDLEVELRRWRHPNAETRPSNAIRLDTSSALEYRDAGNLPDELDRSLRLVLILASAEELLALDQKRLIYEPDHHEAPSWRREGSRPVNVVPLRTADVTTEPVESWTDDAQMAALEREWEASGCVRGIGVAPEVRGFVYKTVLALESAGRPVTVEGITDSLQRWLSPPDVQRVRDGLDGPTEG